MAIGLPSISEKHPASNGLGTKDLAGPLFVIGAVAAIGISAVTVGLLSYYAGVFGSVNSVVDSVIDWSLIGGGGLLLTGSAIAAAVVITKKLRHRQSEGSEGAQKQAGTRTYTVMTWDVSCQDPLRLEEAAKVVETVFTENRPDIICLQGVSKARDWPSTRRNFVKAISEKAFDQTTLSFVPRLPEDQAILWNPEVFSNVNKQSSCFIGRYFTGTLLKEKKGGEKIGVATTTITDPSKEDKNSPFHQQMKRRKPSIMIIGFSGGEGKSGIQAGAMNKSVPIVTQNATYYKGDFGPLQPPVIERVTVTTYSRFN